MIGKKCTYFNTSIFGPDFENSIRFSHGLDFEREVVKCGLSIGKLAFREWGLKDIDNEIFVLQYVHELEKSFLLIKHQNGYLECKNSTLLKHNDYIYC